MNTFRLWCVLIIFSVTALASKAQEFTAQGSIKDSAGEPLPGASVIVKGTTHGVVSDLDGNFSIKVKSGDRLVFSYIGYSDQVIPASAEQMNVILEMDSNFLEETVVVGYGTQKYTKFCKWFPSYFIHK